MASVREASAEWAACVLCAVTVCICTPGTRVPISATGLQPLRRQFVDMHAQVFKVGKIRNFSCHAGLCAEAVVAGTEAVLREPRSVACRRPPTTASATSPGGHARRALCWPSRRRSATGFWFSIIRHLALAQASLPICRVWICGSFRCKLRACAGADRGRGR